MCSNPSLADSIECYMDELIECFEDFVKKSLIIISVGIAAVVGMLLYLLKVVSDRPPPSNFITQGESSAPNQIRSTELEENIKNQDRLYSRKLKQKTLCQGSNTSLSKASSCKITTGVNTVSSYTNTPPLTNKLSFDEKVLRDVGLSSCSKLHCCERTNSQSYIPSRVPVPCMPPTKRKSLHAIRPTRSKHYIPSLPTCPKSVPKKGSCCSICCDDEPLP